MRTLAPECGGDPRAYQQRIGEELESASAMEQPPIDAPIGSPRLYEDCADVSIGRQSSFEHNNNNNGSGGCVVPYAGEPTATLMRSSQSQTLLPYCIFSPTAAQMGYSQVAPFHTLAPGAQLQQFANGGAAQFPLTLFPNMQGSGDAAAATGSSGLYTTLHNQTLSPQATINPYSVQYMLQPQLTQPPQHMPVASTGKRSAFTPPARRRAEPLQVQLAEQAAIGFQPIDAPPPAQQQQNVPSGRHTAIQLYGGASGAQTTSVSYGISGRQSEGRCQTAGAKSYALVKGEFV